MNISFGGDFLEVQNQNPSLIESIQSMIEKEFPDTYQQISIYITVIGELRDSLFGKVTIGEKPVAIFDSKLMNNPTNSIEIRLLE